MFGLIRTATALAALVVLAAASAAPSRAAYYADKTITVLVGFSAGGGTDTTARVLARHIGRYIAGHPDVVVKNMPGAGGIKALNFIAEKARPDGLTVIWQTWNPTAQLIGAPGTRYDYTRLTMLGASLGAPYLMFVRKDVLPGGLSDPADIVKVKGLKYSGLRPSVTLDLHGRLSLDLLGIEYQYISGYRGAAKVRAAIRRGEGHITTHGLNGYRSGVEPTMVRQGVVTPLWYWEKLDATGNFVPSAEITDMPTFREVYRKARGAAPSGPLWDALNLVIGLYGHATNYFWGPPGVDREATAAFRDAFYKLLADPAVVAEQKKTFGFAYDAVPIARAQKVVADLATADPKVVSFLKSYIANAPR